MKTTTKRKTEWQSVANYNDNNLKALDEHIAEASTATRRQVYTLIQVNSPCSVNITKKSHEVLAKIVMG